MPIVLSGDTSHCCFYVNLSFLSKPLDSHDICTGPTGKVSEPSRKHLQEDNSSVSAMQQLMDVIQLLTFWLSCLVSPPPSTQPSCSPQPVMSEVSCSAAHHLSHQEPLYGVCCTLAYLSDPPSRPQALSTWTARPVGPFSALKEFSCFTCVRSLACC